MTSPYLNGMHDVIGINLNYDITYLNEMHNSVPSPLLVLKCNASLTGGEDRFDVNRTAKRTLVLIKVLRIQPYSLISYRLKFNLQSKR